MTLPRNILSQLPHPKREPPWLESFFVFKCRIKLNPCNWTQVWFWLIHVSIISSKFAKQKIKKQASACASESTSHTVAQFFQSVSILQFQAYGHGNSYQYSKAIQEGGPIHRRASAVKQSTKSSGLTHAHQTVCRLSQRLNGTKSKVVDASGWSALLRYCIRGLFRQLQHWLHCVKANQRENDESSYAGHTQCTNGTGQMVEKRGGTLGILKKGGPRSHSPTLNRYSDIFLKKGFNFKSKLSFCNRSKSWWQNIQVKQANDHISSIAIDLNSFLVSHIF